MREHITMIVFGALLLPMGILNFRGDIRSIHWYNRRKITEETRRPYGRLMGIGAILLSVSFMVSGALSWLLESEWPYTISAVAAFISVSIILYAQFKYNKGIF